MAMLSRARPRRRGDQSGSGTAIGVAVVFPMLMLVIVALRMLTDSTRIEQGIQATANQAARTAALCCHYTGRDPSGPVSADAAARAALAAAEGPGNRIECANDFAGEADIVFVSVDDQVVPIAADAPVPLGGTVFVTVTCRIPPAILGGYGILGLDAERTTTAVASIDPFRHRSGA